MAAPPRDLRAALLAAAEDEVAATGVGGVSLRAIARRAGVSHQAPGHVFGDGAGLFTALAERAHDALAETVGAAWAASDAPAPERLAAVGVAYVAFAETRGSLFAVMVRPELWNADDPGLAAARERAWGVLEHAVAAARDEGWGRGVDARTLVLLCLSTVHGLASLARDGVLAVDEPGTSTGDLARRLTGALNVLGGG